MRKRKRLYAHVHGLKNKKIADMIRNAIDLENKIGDISNIVLLSKVGKKSTGLARQFANGGGIRIIGGPRPAECIVPVKCTSPKTYQAVPGEVLVTMDLDSDEILILDDNFEINTIIALAQLPNNVEKWARISNAVSIENNTIPAPYAYPICVVIKALEALTNAIDMSTGLSHSSDERLAKTYLRACEKYKVPLQAEEIESYLIRQLHWKKAHANHLLTIIQKINNGESFEGGGRTKLYYHIQRWEEECIDNK